MLSNRPYLLRAFYQWIVDSACTPILVIDANHPRCKIPMDYVEAGEIVFNISSSAVRDLKISNELIEFKASFSGVIHIISAPIKAILAIYAEENGEGIFFDAEEGDGGDTGDEFAQLKSIDTDMNEPSVTSAEPERDAKRTVKKGKPFLKLVE
jgi:stringent starvation protein B